MNIKNKTKKRTEQSKSIKNTDQFPIKVYRNKITGHDTPLLYLHWHKDLEFIIVTTGILQVTIEGRIFTINKGETAFIHPNFIHSATSISDISCTFFVINIPPSYIDTNEISELFITYGQPLLSNKLVFKEHLTLEEPWGEQVFCILHNISLMCQTSPYESELLIRSKFFELLYIYFYNCDYEVYSSKGKKRAIKLSHVVDFIHKNYTTDLSLKQLADVISISESQLCRLFKDELGISPFTYIIRHRIISSCYRLHETNDKISTIATSIGFSNISYYNREFRNIVGCTPSEYRRYRMDIDTKIPLS